MRNKIVEINKGNIEISAYLLYFTKTVQGISYILSLISRANLLKKRFFLV